MITKITAVTNVEVQPTTTASMIQNFVDGVTFPFTGATEERMDSPGTRYVAAAWTAIGIIIGSKVTRSRLNTDPSAEPVLGVFF